MTKLASVSAEEEKKLLFAYKLLNELAAHDVPAVSYNCRKAKNELWQALFELDLIPFKEDAS